MVILEFAMNRHVSLFTMATTMWTLFLLAGLPSNYYLTWSFTAQLLLIVVVPTIVLMIITHRRLRAMPRDRAIPAALWIAFYFTVPFAIYDCIYLGAHLKLGSSFLSSHWYLTAFYVTPWITLPWLAFARPADTKHPEGRRSDPVPGH